MSNPIEGVALAPSQVEFVTAHKQEASAIATQVAGLPDNPDLLSKALSFVQSKIKGIEDTRLSITEPLTRAKNNVDSHFRELRSPFEEAKALLKNRLESLENARRALVAAANQPKALPEVALPAQGPCPWCGKPHGGGPEWCNGNPDPVFSLPTAVVATTIPQPVGSFKLEWTWELDDLSKVPLEFLALNAATLKLYASKHKNSDTIPPIPGIRFAKVAKAIAR